MMLEMKYSGRRSTFSSTAIDSELPAAPFTACTVIWPSLGARHGLRRIHAYLERAGWTPAGGAARDGLADTAAAISGELQPVTAGLGGPVHGAGADVEYRQRLCGRCLAAAYRIEFHSSGR